MARSGRRRFARWLVVGGSFLVAAAALAVVFDELWMRPLAQRYVRSHAGRSIDFARVRWRLDAGEPRLTLFRLSVENAPWADTARPLIEAGEFGVTIAWASLWHGPLLIRRMALVDADVDLQRTADGLRNWRLSQPDDRGPGRVRVQRLEATRTRLRVADAVAGLDMTVSSTPAPNGASLRAHGTVRGVALDATAAVPTQLTFYDTGAWFDLTGEVSTAHGRLAVQGKVRDLMQFGGFSGDLRLSGRTPGEFAAWAATALPALPDLPLSGSAHLDKDGGHWVVPHFVARLGASDLAGSIDYRAEGGAGSRPMLQGRWVSEQVDPAEWRARPAVAPGAADAPRRAVPPLPFDADLDWRVASVRGLPLPVGAVHAVLLARPGSWRLAPLEATVAGGRVSGEARLGTDADPVQLDADLRLHGLPLDAFGGGRIAGRLDARATLHARGRHPADWLASLSGDAGAHLVGASLPARLEAKLGLDGGRWLQAVFADDSRRPVTCSDLQLRLDRGRAEVRRLVLETAAVTVDGSGSIDLRHRAVDLLLTPQRKHPTLLALDQSLRVTGTPGKMRIDLADEPPTARRAACVPVAP